MKSTAQETKLKLAAYYTTEYSGYGVPAGLPSGFTFWALFETLEEADEFVALFPKSAKFRAGRHSGYRETERFHASVQSIGQLVPNGVNLGRNEAGIKRYRTIIAAAERLGIEIEYGSEAQNAYWTREGFEAAIA